MQKNQDKKGKKKKKESLDPMYPHAANTKLTEGLVLRVPSLEFRWVDFLGPRFWAPDRTIARKAGPHQALRCDYRPACLRLRPQSKRSQWAPPPDSHHHYNHHDHHRLGQSLGSSSWMGPLLLFSRLVYASDSHFVFGSSFS